MNDKQKMLNNVFVYYKWLEDSIPESEVLDSDVYRELNKALDIGKKHGLSVADTLSAIVLPLLDTAAWQWVDQHSSENCWIDYLMEVISNEK